jgi:GTPase Era involved in 16S rRNA processing
MSEMVTQSTTVAPPLPLAELQESLRGLAHESELHDFGEMRDRVQERFRDSHNPLLVMVVGEGKFGKSSLINALSGKTVAPVSIVPKTWKVDLYEAIEGSEDAMLSWRSNPDAPEKMAIPEATRVCSEQEAKALESKAKELSWKSDLYQVHWHVNAAWPPQGVALVDTPGFSQLRSDTSISNTFLYGSKGIVFEASDAFKYYFFRADVVLWCIRCDRLQDHETLEMLKASGKRNDIVGILTHMDKIPNDRWSEVERKASEIYGEYISTFFPSALGSRARHDLIDALRGYLEAQYISKKDETKADAIKAFLSSELDHFASDVNSVMGLYYENFATRIGLLQTISEEIDHILPSARQALDDVAQRYYDKAVSKLPALWDQADGNIESFEACVRNYAAEPRLLCAELTRTVVTTANEAVNSTNLSLSNAAWKGVRLNAEASPQAFSSKVLSQITSVASASVAGLQTTFTGGEGLGTGLTVGAVGAGIGIFALGPIGLAAGAIGFLVGKITKRGRCMSKAKDALKGCYDQNVQRQLDALNKSLDEICKDVRKAVDASLCEHHGKDIAGVMSHAVLADNSCMGLPPLVRQTVKTLFAVRCKMLDQQDEITSF